MLFIDCIIKAYIFQDGKYYMGVRSIAELLQYFKDTYDDSLQICTLCKQELFYGKRCKKCDATTHVYCFENYTKNGGSGCPNCHQPISIRDHSDNNASCMHESQMEIDDIA